MNEPRSSQSLFETASNDVRHSVSVVDERWGREKRRRRLLMLKWCLPLFIIVVGGGLFACWKAQVFPFEEAYVEPVHHHEEAEETQTAENKPDEVMGNPDAKLVIQVLLAKGTLLDESWKRILTDLADTKPSQVYVEFWEMAKAPKKYKEELAPIYSTVLLINGKTTFNYIDHKGRKATLSGTLDSMAEYDALGLTAVLNQTFKAVTGESKPPLDGSPYMAEAVKKEEYRRRHSLPDIQSSREKAEASRGSDGTTILLPTMKLDVD